MANVARCVHVCIANTHDMKPSTYSDCIRTHACTSQKKARLIFQSENMHNNHACICSCEGVHADTVVERCVGVCVYMVTCMCTFVFFRPRTRMCVCMYAWIQRMCRFERNVFPHMAHAWRSATIRRIYVHRKRMHQRS